MAGTARWAFVCVRVGVRNYIQAWGLLYVGVATLGVATSGLSGCSNNDSSSGASNEGGTSGVAGAEQASSGFGGQASSGSSGMAGGLQSGSAGAVDSGGDGGIQVCSSAHDPAEPSDLPMGSCAVEGERCQIETAERCDGGYLGAQLDWVCGCDAGSWHCDQVGGTTATCAE